MNTTPPVSDHAVIRYLERVLGIDVERHRREISARVRRGADLGASGVVADGFVYKMQDGTVTTVMKASMPNVHTGRVRRERPDGDNP